MPKSSAELALKNMEYLLNEKIYFPTMSTKETIWKLEQIKKDYGLEKYLRVLKIVEEHLNTKKTLQNKIRDYIKNNSKKGD